MYFGRDNDYRIIGRSRDSLGEFKRNSLSDHDDDWRQLQNLANRQDYLDLIHPDDRRDGFRTPLKLRITCRETVLA
jgi:hypothetical protein